MKKLVILCLAVFFFVSLVTISYAKVIAHESSVVKIGEDINMGEKLNFKSLVAIKGSVNVKGRVDTDVVAVLGSIHLYPTAKVGGDVVAIGGNIIKDEGAVIEGDVVNIAISKGGADFMEMGTPVMGVMAICGFLLFKLFMLIGFLALAAVVISFMTKQVGMISSNIETGWFKSLLWGILGSILICPIAILLAITVVGLPLILVEVIFASAAFTLGYIAVSQVIGKRFTIAIRRPNKPMLTEVIIGLILLFLIDLVPFIGGLIKTVAVIIGFGSAIVTKLGFEKFKV